MDVSLSQRAFADLLGVSNVAVNRAIRNGRLKAGVNDGRIVDVEAARAEYLATQDLTRAPPYVRERSDALHRGEVVPAVRDPSHGGRPPKARAAPPRGESARAAGEAPPARVAPVAALGASLSDNNAAKAYWQAMQAELDYRRDAGELVPAVEVRGAVEAAFRRCRGKLLAIPGRVGQQLPEIGPAGVALVERLVREALEDLAAGAVARE